MAAAARLEAVSKSFGGTRALSSIDLEANRGEILALLGPNGAGKSTAINVLTGLRRVDSGSVMLLGGEPRDIAVRRQIGLTPQESGVPPTLRVREIMRLVRAHYPIALVDEELFERFRLKEIWNRQAGGLSGGQKRTLAVAMAFAGNPELVFLDEPTTGLDVEARRLLWAAIGAYRQQGGTVVLTTHYLEEAEALADRVIVIDRGRAVAQGTVDDIRRRVGQAKVSYKGDAPDGLPGVARATVAGGKVTAFVEDSDVFVRALVGSGRRFEEIEVRRASLEEAFVEITGEEPS